MDGTLWESLEHSGHGHHEAKMSILGLRMPRCVQPGVWGDGRRDAALRVVAWKNL